MSWTSIAFIVLAIGLVIGPITALLPNRYQRRVAQMRSRAANLGIQVRLVEFGGKDRLALASYGLPWNKSETVAAKSMPSWQLVRGDMEHEIHFSGVWDWGKPSLVADRRWHLPLQHLLKRATLDNLFEQINVLEQNPQGFLIFWTERAELEAVERIAELLAGLKRFALQQTPDIEWPIAVKSMPIGHVGQH